MAHLNLGQIMQLVEQGSALFEQLKPLLDKVTTPKVTADYNAFHQLVIKMGKDIDTLKAKLSDGKIDNDDALAAVDVLDDAKAISQGIETLSSNFGTDFDKLKARFHLG